MIQRIKDELERRTKYQSSEFNDGYNQALGDILYFIEAIEQEPFTVIKGWVAREKAGNLILFPYAKPQRDPINEPEYWTNGMECIVLPFNLFPDLTWENEPIEVELPIRKV